jgi:integrase
MERFDLVDSWLDNVGLSHSNSDRTRVEYKRWFDRFCSFIAKTPEQIVKDYECSTLSNERQIIRKYAQYIQAFSSALFKEKQAPCSVGSAIGAVKSFFKYNSLNAGQIPAVRMRVIYHNRDITHEEVKLILDASRPRERAFFTVMAQSGLRPDTICNLKYKHIKEDLSNHIIPSKISVPEEITKGKYHSYFTFIGEEAVHYLESYLYTRRNMTDEDYLFVKQGTDEKTDPKSISGLFARTVQKLKIRGLIQVEQKEKRKPRNIRLYNLRKWFRKHAGQAGFEFYQFWMGHTIGAGQEEHYRPTDVEFHRKKYTEQAMPFLRLETATPTETEKTIAELKKQLEERDKEMKTVKETMAKIQPLVDFVNQFDTPEHLKAALGILTDEHRDERLRPLEVSPSVSDRRKKTIEQTADEIVRSEARFKQLAEKRGLPMTHEEYEKRRKKRMQMPKTNRLHKTQFQ